MGAAEINGDEVHGDDSLLGRSSRRLDTRA
jgi:hypothetical protein